MKVGAIILARLDSHRLPSKALSPIAGRPLVAWVIDVCRATPGLDQTLLATTSRPVDDPLVAYAESAGLACFRGDVDDVAGRFLAAMAFAGLDGALRVNGDSPFNRPALLGGAIEVFRRGGVDLVTNVPGRTYPFGMSVEVIAHQAMETACRRMAVADHREHVTKFFYDHPDDFQTHQFTAEAPDLGGLQLAVDSPADARQAEWLIDRLGPRMMQADAAEVATLARQYQAMYAA